VSRLAGVAQTGIAPSPGIQMQHALQITEQTVVHVGRRLRHVAQAGRSTAPGIVTNPCHGMPTEVLRWLPVKGEAEVVKQPVAQGRTKVAIDTACPGAEQMKTLYFQVA